eukprot:2973816-Alexandrium_andersonii.AAC.1
MCIRDRVDAQLSRRLAWLKGGARAAGLGRASLLGPGDGHPVDGEPRRRCGGRVLQEAAAQLTED